MDECTVRFWDSSANQPEPMELIFIPVSLLSMSAVLSLLTQRERNVRQMNVLEQTNSIPKLIDS